MRGNIYCLGGGGGFPKPSTVGNPVQVAAKREQLGLEVGDSKVPLKSCLALRLHVGTTYRV